METDELYKLNEFYPEPESAWFQLASGWFQFNP
jgi:hypothetical protein